MHRKVLIAVVAVVAGLLLLAVGPGVSFIADLWWFRDAGFGTVFTTQVGTQAVLFGIGAVAFAVLAGVNVVIARRLSPLRPLAITNDFLFNLRRSVDPMIRLVLGGTIAFAAVIFGTALMPRWTQVLLALNSTPFKKSDPIFNRDISFYVFDLAMWKLVVGWLFVALVIVVLFVAAVYAYAGAIGPQPEGGYVAPAARVHLGVLLGFVLLAKAASYQINQWELLYATTGEQVYGASATDVYAQLPAYRVLFWIAIFSAILLFATFATKRLVIPIVAIALMAVAAVVIGGIYPRAYQAFSVNPNELEKERPFIADNIEFTRAAFGLDKVQVSDYPANDTLTAAQLVENVDTLRNVRLWDDQPLLDNMQQLQEFKQFYRFTSTAVDRYPVNGRQTQVLISARNVTPDSLPQANRTWQNLHLVYTHGYGTVAAQSNATQADGTPDFLVKDIPVTTTPGAESLVVDQPRIYFGYDPAFTGGDPDEFIVVNTKTAEIDPLAANAENIDEPDAAPTYSYTGDAGIPMDSFFNRLVFALRFGDTKFILSDTFTDKSKLLYDRDARVRLQRAAPFLQFDRKPYLSVVEGRLVWIVDAYTTSSLYPYSKPVDEGFFTGENYLRNSVKGTVDAYTGEARLWVVDPQDPIAASWAKALPGVLTPVDQAPAALRERFRYPFDLFEAQLLQYELYHMTDPSVFYKKEASWAVAQRAPQSLQQAQIDAAAAQDPFRAQRIVDTGPITASQYLQLKLPGDDTAQMVLVNSFRPARADRLNLTSLFIARADPERYGELLSLRMPQGVTVEGPEQAAGQIDANNAISTAKTPLNLPGGSSRIIDGTMQVVPIGGALMYVRPWYLTADNLPFPKLNSVIVVFGEKVVRAATFREALEQVFGTGPLALDGLEPATGQPAVPSTPAPPAEPGQQQPAPTPTPPTVDVKALAERANTVYTQMQDALRNGDLESYGRLEKQLGQLLEQLAAQAPGA